MNGYKYKAFISYSHADEKWASWLHTNIERYRVPQNIVQENELASNRLWPIFRDREELASSSSLSADIQQALAESENLIVICSPNAAQSRWVNEEAKEFKRLGREDYVFCFLIGDPELSFPSAVLMDVDGDGLATVGETEPLAADARRGADGRHRAKLKIIAGLLGVRLDALAQREIQRQQRRLVAGIAFSMIGTVLAVALSTYAIVQRDHAIEEARVSSRITDFMIDVFKTPDPYGQQAGDVTARELLDVASTKIESELEAEPAIRARLMLVMGTVHRNLGLYDRAKRLYEAVVAIYEEELGPLHSDTLAAMGEVAQTQTSLGDFQNAEALARRVSELLRQQLGENSETYIDSLEVLEGTLMRQIAFNQGLADEVLELCEKVYAHRKASHGADATATLIALNNVAAAHQFLGDHARSLEARLQIVEIRLSTLGPKHPLSIHAQYVTGHSYRALGLLEQAEIAYSEAYKLRKEVLGVNHSETLKVQKALGETIHDRYLYSSDPKLLNDALAHQETALRGYRENYSPNQQGRFSAQSSLIETLLSAGRADEAEQLSRELQSVFGDRTSVLWNLATSLSLQGKKAESAELLGRLQAEFLGQANSEKATPDDLHRAALSLTSSCSAKLQQPQHALRYLNSAISKHPEQHQYYASKSYAHYLLGEVESADEALREAMRFTEEESTFSTYYAHSREILGKGLDWSPLWDRCRIYHETSILSRGFRSDAMADNL